jgi:hypothetical protein
MSTTTVKPRSKMNSDEKIAADLSWPVKAVGARLKFLGLFVPCSRCHGSGHYSFNQIDGTRCYGCNGRGEVMPKWSKSLIESAKARVADGALEPYFARVARIREAKAALVPALVAARESYMRTASAYEKAFKAGTLHTEEAGGIYEAQTRANNLYWYDKRTANEGVSWISMRSGCLFPAVREIEDMAKRGDLDAELALAMVNERIERLNAITW